MGLSDVSPETQTDPADIWEPEPIVIPYDEVLAPVVGHLDRLDVEAVGDGVLRFTGIGNDGRTVSGAMRSAFVVGEDGRSIELTWEVKLAR